MTPFPDQNYLIDKVDDPIARSSANSLVAVGTGLITKAYTFFKNKQQARKAAEAYAQKYCARYGKIRLLGMPQDINLEDIYTSVKFLDHLSINNRFGSLNALEDDYRSAGKRRFQWIDCQSKQGSEVVNEHQYLYVLGNPGAGKSTFLRRVGLEALKGEYGKYKHDCIPVMIELKQFNKGSVDLVAAIANELANFGFPDNKNATEDYLKKGQLLILLDALDEVTHAYTNEVLDNIARLVTKYSQNRFILSCRIAAYRSSMTGFTTVELANFDDFQMEKFICNWFGSESDRKNKVAEECWAKLNQPEYAASKELAQTPLLLTFLCIVYDTYQDFPAQRSQLCEEALDILLRRWDAEKRLKRDKIYANWNINLEKALLSQLAYDFFSQDQLFFTKKQVLEYIDVFLADTAGDSKYVDTEAVLDAIAIQQGILVERAQGIYSFSHLTLQEYLTAQYISQDLKRIEKLVEQHLTDERWKEVFLLVAGIRNNADDLLLLIEEQANLLIKRNRKIRKLLKWSDSVIDRSNNDIEPALKKITMLACVLPVFCSPTLNIIRNYLMIIHYLTIERRYRFNYNLQNIFNSIFMIISSLMTYVHGFKTIYAEEDENIKPFNLLYFKEKVQKIQTLGFSKKIDFDGLIEILEKVSADEPTTKNNDSEDAVESIKKYANKIIGIWLKYFQVEQTTVYWEMEEIPALEQYIYTNLLLLECKHSATRVSQQVWIGIISRMLSPICEKSADTAV